MKILAKPPVSQIVAHHGGNMYTVSQVLPGPLSMIANQLHLVQQLKSVQGQQVLEL